jgi:hypothetical protein
MRALFVSLLLAVAVVAQAGEPRGQRVARPVATQVVIAEAALVTGGAPATLIAGVPVVVKGSLPVRGKVRITVVGPVEVSGTVDASLLGQVVIEETALVAEGDVARKDAPALGLLRPGALVRVLSTRGDNVVVETAGTVHARGVVSKKALAPRPTELVLDREWQTQATKPVDLHADKGLAGKPIAHLEAGCKLQLVAQEGDLAHVRTVGGVIIEGWATSFDLAARTAPPAPAGEPMLIKPTHEVFVDAPIFADPAGRSRLGIMHGGALVEGNQRSIDAHVGDKVGIAHGMIKVTSPAPVIVEGWMKLADLRDLAAAGDAIK